MWQTGSSRLASSGATGRLRSLDGPEGQSAVSDQPDWYRRAVFYEVPVRGFYDANGDGIGDLRGLQEKLEYLEWLGVDCLWLLPYYPSPMRDGGYDISDFMTIHPDLGTDRRSRRSSWTTPIAAGIRIIADLVMNHTSDEHPWFIESRSSRTNPTRGLVRLERRRQAVARGAGRLRRRRDLELDLGPGAPAVLLAPLLLAPARPQLRQSRRRGRDVRRGPSLARPRARRVPPRRRLLPVPARRHDRREPSRRPTRCLRRLRKEIDSCVSRARCFSPRPTSGRADLVDFFGQGDECQMCFHFPLMPRLFMAVRREQRFPVTEILEPVSRDPRRAASGRSSCATTTSSRWRRSQKKSATTWSPSTRRTRGCSGTSGSGGGSRLCSTGTGVWPSCSSPCCSRSPAARSSTTATSC